MDLTLCQSLLKWLKTFPGQENLTIQRLADGVAIASTLNQIAPEFFSAHWLSKIKTDVGDNWRLKVSNLRKIHEGVMDYHREHLDQPVGQYPAPNLNKIGEHNDETELGRLLQLVLGCVINCQQKQRHIEAIMQMEEDVQTVIVKAIQDLMNSENPVAARSPNPSSPLHQDPAAAAVGAYDQLESATRDKEEALKRCIELDHQLSLVTEERNHLKDKNEQLRKAVDSLSNPDANSGVSTSRFKELKKEVENLRDDLYKSEMAREEYRSRLENLEKENQDLNVRILDLQPLAIEARALKDEVDALNDMKEKVALYESNIESYRKKQEELGGLKRQVKLLEEKNSEYMQQNVELEEELKEERKKSSTWRPQLDLLRQQVNELHQRIGDETKKTDKIKFENKKLTEKMEAEIEEKKRILRNFEILKEKHDELKYSTVNSENASRGNYAGLESAEHIPHQIREKLARLQLENSTLRKQCNEPDPVLQSKLDDLAERHDKLLQENRALNQHVMELESDLEDAKTHSAVTHHSSISDPNSARTDLERDLNRKAEKISTLEENLSKKEAEMISMEERYKRYLNKAKSVIRTLDPKQNPSLVPDVSVLRSQLLEKEKLIENMERESEKAKRIRETEEKLISTAFYNIGMQRHKQMVSQRLANLDNPQTFLSRQRQTSARRNMSNVNNSEFHY